MHVNFNTYFRNLLPEGNLITSYKGYSSNILVDSILVVTEANLMSLEEKPKLRRRVYQVMVEALQNIYHHSQEKTDKSIIFILSKDGEEYFIQTGNYIGRNQIEDLKGQLDTINQLDKEEVKALYRQRLKDGTISEKGGAGLGILDMARRSGEKLDYAFQEMEDTGDCLFHLKVKIIE